VAISNHQKNSLLSLLSGTLRYFSACFSSPSYRFSSTLIPQLSIYVLTKHTVHIKDDNHCKQTSFTLSRSARTTRGGQYYHLSARNSSSKPHLVEEEYVSEHKKPTCRRRLGSCPRKVHDCSKKILARSFDHNQYSSWWTRRKY
jgi:hypothetical protein